MEAGPMRCPKAKLLAGSWMCPCHGMSRVRVRKPKPDPVDAMFDGMLRVLERLANR